MTTTTTAAPSPTAGTHPPYSDRVSDRTRRRWLIAVWVLSAAVAIACFLILGWPAGHAR